MQSNVENIQGQIVGLTDSVNLLQNTGCKNFLLFPHYAHSHTINGMEFEEQPDGTVILDGTATASAYHQLFCATPTLNKDYYDT